MKKECKDHLGNIYSSVKDMCNMYKHYDITEDAYRSRLKLGWTLEEALTTPVRDLSVYDHLGNKYPNIKTMCKHYGITDSAYQSRLKLGWTLEETLTTPLHSVYDHLGNKYSGTEKMCKQYGITRSVYKIRLKLGWTLEETLTTPVKDFSTTDHLGNKYPNIKTMCKHYGITDSAYLSRLKHGWAPEKALTTSMQDLSVYDHLGNKYPNIKTMCKHYGITMSMYEGRLNLGWALEETLTVPRNMYIGEHRVAECLKRLNVRFYHDCTIKTIFTDLGISIDWNDFLSELQSKLGLAGYNWSKQKIQRLRPDFVLYTDEDNKIRGVIEFDGEQHQNFVEFFFKTIEEFYKLNDADFAKQSFWEYMNIPMLRIRHDQIDMLDDMIQDFIKNPQDYIHNHNTYLTEEKYWQSLAEQKRQIDDAFAA